ncbi:MAG: alpha/beta hydrolase-fold protein [Pseudomonadota bacterium]|uniref:alpha/beta hydrolase n=1 Tax=Sphingomonas sp. ERG5 TaxID=1381597 RepID=UPI001364C13D|nr:alpha/beta hydrolase-fold protein [Sphingomonas sp. ERG5]
MVAKPTTEPWALLCCSLQTGLQPIPNSGLAAVTVRVPRLREAVLKIATTPKGTQEPEIYRGPDAEPAPPRLDTPNSTITVYDLPSKVMGESRRLTIYVPAGTPPRAKLPVFYLGDGASRAFAPIAAAASRDGRARPAVLVGIDAAPNKKDCTGMGCDRRAPEYLADVGGAGPDSPYIRHQRFLVEEVLPYVEAHYPVSRRRSDRVIGGYSNGGAWALTTAGKYSSVFGNALAMSAAAMPAAEPADRLKKVRVFGGAGIFEPSFHKRTANILVGAKAAGADTQFREVASGHDLSTWETIFADSYHWFFPVRQ